MVRLLLYVAKYWKGRMHTCQTFGNNKLANHLCTTFKYFKANFAYVRKICQSCKYLIPPRTVVYICVLY